jgi:electron transfer flavoprotein alpha subunit
VQGGSYLVESSVNRGVPVLVVRTEHVTVTPAPATPTVSPLRMTFPGSVRAVRTISRPPGGAARRPALSTAAVIVAGGRGVGSREAFGLVHRLAAALGGTAGGSHAATELGWCPREAQVDQVGTVVHPSLYLALGVSGSLRHRAGMRGAATVVAIDRDPAAPIFQLSDLGVVGDVHEVVPELLAEIERRRALPVISEA